MARQNVGMGKPEHRAGGRAGMTSLELRYSGRCGLCGSRLRGVWVGSFRVNKAVLVATSPGLLFVERKCSECEWETPAASKVSDWELTADSLALVTASRARRGWLA